MNTDKHIILNYTYISTLSAIYSDHHLLGPLIFLIYKLTIDYNQLVNFSLEKIYFKCFIFNNLLPHNLEINYVIKYTSFSALNLSHVYD